MKAQIEKLTKGLDERCREIGEQYCRGVTGDIAPMYDGLTKRDIQRVVKLHLPTAGPYIEYVKAEKAARKKPAAGTDAGPPEDVRETAGDAAKGPDQELDGDALAAILDDVGSDFPDGDDGPEINPLAMAAKLAHMGGKAEPPEPRKDDPQTAAIIPDYPLMNGVVRRNGTTGAFGIWDDDKGDWYVPAIQEGMEFDALELGEWFPSKVVIERGSYVFRDVFDAYVDTISVTEGLRVRTIQGLNTK